MVVRTNASHSLFVILVLVCFALHVLFICCTECAYAFCVLTCHYYSNLIISREFAIRIWIEAWYFNVGHDAKASAFAHIHTGTKWHGMTIDDISRIQYWIYVIFFSRCVCVSLCVCVQLLLVMHAHVVLVNNDDGNVGDSKHISPTITIAFETPKTSWHLSDGKRKLRDCNYNFAHIKSTASVCGAVRVEWIWSK